MHCNAKTMVRVGLLLAAGLASTYLAFPQARELVAASAPVLLALICPISMIAMMLMMKRSGSEERSCTKPETDRGGPAAAGTPSATRTSEPAP